MKTKKVKKRMTRRKKVIRMWSEICETEYKREKKDPVLTLVLYHAYPPVLTTNTQYFFTNIDNLNKPPVNLIF